MDQRDAKVAKDATTQGSETMEKVEANEGESKTKYEQSIGEKIHFLRKAMIASDDFAVAIRYIDSEKKITHRKISPVRFTDDKRESILALCLCREEHRTFKLSQMLEVQLIDAATVQMPEPIIEED